MYFTTKRFRWLSSIRWSSSLKRPADGDSRLILFYDDLRCSNKKVGSSLGATLWKAAVLTARYFIGTQHPEFVTMSNALQR